MDAEVSVNNRFYLAGQSLCRREGMEDARSQCTPRIVEIVNPDSKIMPDHMELRAITKNPYYRVGERFIMHHALVAKLYDFQPV